MRAGRHLLPALVAVTGWISFGPTAQADTGLPDDFAPLVRRLMKRDQVPGVVVGVVEGGRLVYAQGFGYRDVEMRLPVTPGIGPLPPTSSPLASTGSEIWLSFSSR